MDLFFSLLVGTELYAGVLFLKCVCIYFKNFSVLTVLHLMLFYVLWNLSYVVTVFLSLIHILQNSLFRSQLLARAVDLLIGILAY